MKPVERSEILDYVTYEERRAELRPAFLAAKAKRRVRVGEYLNFLFENRDTVRYQVQEMMRVEQIVKEADILHELKTYNELLGKDGGVGCCLLIEIDDPEERAQKLTAWLKLPEHLYLKLADGTKVRAVFDERQVGETRVSSVQYLQFPVGGQTPIAVGVDHPDLNAETTLEDEQKAALAEDLAQED